MSYTKQEIINKIRNINKISEIYTNRIINYRGKTKDTQEKYTEVIAEEILNNSEKYNFDSIEQIKRKLGYKTNTHNGIFNEMSNRREEIIAMKMYKKNYSDLGEMMDYQVPLKDRKNIKAGKVDLISYKESTNTLYLIELKNDTSKESLLRCALEIITYSKQIDANRLKIDFGLNSNVNMKPAILIFEKTRPYFDLEDRYVKELIYKFKIDVFITKAEELFEIKKY